MIAKYILILPVYRQELIGLDCSYVIKRHVDPIWMYSHNRIILYNEFYI